MSLTAALLVLMAVVSVLNAIIIIKTHTTLQQNYELRKRNREDENLPDHSRRG